MTIARRRPQQQATESFLPVDRNAVESLLGCALAFPDVFDSIATIVQANDFIDGNDRQIFAAAKSLHDAGEPVVVVSVAQRLGNAFAAIGGAPRLLQLMESATLPQHAEYIAGLVRQDADRVRVLESAVLTTREASDRTRDVNDVIIAAKMRLEAIEDRNKSADDPVGMCDGVLKVLGDLADKTPPISISSGYADLDRLLGGGFRNEHMIVLAARPGMGKSALVGNIAGKTADRGVPVLVFSLEQPRDELLHRLLSSVSRVSHESIRNHDLNEQDECAVCEAGARMSGWPLWIDDKARRTVDQIAAISRRHKRRFGLGLIVIDYMQLISPSDPSVNREQQVSSISRSLKALARDDLKVPMIVLAQLNRELEKRDDKRPKLSDLRESGAIEADADIVMFIDRPHEYDRNALPSDATLFVRKNRHGERGDVPLFWRSDTLTFMPAKAVAANDL